MKSVNLDENFISKAKIREKIKEVEKENEEYVQEWEIKDELGAQIDILQELLEG